jgi:thioredoxin-dependent peroxiredoxin
LSRRRLLRIRVPARKGSKVASHRGLAGRSWPRTVRLSGLTAKHRVPTPVNWQPGEDVIIAGSVSSDEARQIFGTWKDPKPYIRIVPQSG